MALIKKFRIKSFKDKETLVELNKVSMFYNKRQILNNLHHHIYLRLKNIGLRE